MSSEMLLRRQSIGDKPDGQERNNSIYKLKFLNAALGDPTLTNPRIHMEEVIVGTLGLLLSENKIACFALISPSSVSSV